MTEAAIKTVKTGRQTRTLKRKACVDCGVEYETPWDRKRYCDECSKERGKAAGKRGAVARAVSKSAALEQIADTRGKQKTSLLDITSMSEALWEVRYAIPFTGSASKNSRWSNNGKGVVYLSKEVRDYQAMIIAATKAAVRNVNIKQNKLWIGFLVEKPNNRFDAINIVDTVCDGIKEAVDLDDRWFCISSLDWVIKKKDPKIIVTISQTSDEDVIICSHCGEMKDIYSFNKKKNVKPFGRDRVCRDCKKILDAQARKARASVCPI